MPAPALLLSDPVGFPEAGHGVKMLGFFGISCTESTTAQFLTGDFGSSDPPAKLRLLCSPGTFLKWVGQLDREPGRSDFWRERIHSVFVHGGADPDPLVDVARRVTGAQKASLQSVNPGAIDWAVSAAHPEFCATMSGLRVRAVQETTEVCLTLDSPTASRASLISCDVGAVLIRGEFRGVPVFVSTASSILDMDAEMTAPNFDIRQYFLQSLPFVLFVKWAFAGTTWGPRQTGACLVIDDPLLKPRYGFLRYVDLLAQMERHGFSTSIAFIPWNWRRSAAKVVDLFRKNPQRLSLSVHGCDHTRREFGGDDKTVLAGKANHAIDRMRRHEMKSGIRHDRVMVFPQGVFSETAMSVLKRSGFTAVVNTEVISSDSPPPPLTVADLWDVAVMKYDSFPLITRRYPSQGIENFAFDILVGKPCLIVIHHDFCRDRCAHLVQFITRLNELNAHLSWGSLGDIVREACRQRELLPGVVDIEMFGAELRLENRSPDRKCFRVRRQESDPSAIREILNGQEPVQWTHADGHIGFEVSLSPGESTLLRVEFHELQGAGQREQPMQYTLKTLARRLLCEVRDNYVTRRPFSA